MRTALMLCIALASVADAQELFRSTPLTPTLLLHDASDNDSAKLLKVLEGKGTAVEAVAYDDMSFETTRYRVDLRARLGNFLLTNLR